MLFLCVLFFLCFSSFPSLSRGYVEWTQLPWGSSSGSNDSSSIDANRDSALLYLYGGLGTADGVPHSSADKDWNDECETTHTDNTEEKIKIINKKQLTRKK